MRYRQDSLAQRLKFSAPGGLVKGVKRNQAVIFLDGLCFFSVINLVLPDSLKV